MKNLLFAVVGLITFNSQAQVTKDMGDFTEIKTTNRIKVQLIPSSKNLVELDSKDEKNVTLVNKNGKLAVKNNIKELVADTDYKVVVKVYFKDLNSIEAESGSYVYSDKTLETHQIKINAYSGSEVHLKIKAKNIDSKAFAGASINLEGKADSGTLIANAGGFIKAKDLIFTNVDATVNAGGNIDVNAISIVNAATRAGGVINIYGNPSTVTEKYTAGGKINRIK